MKLADATKMNMYKEYVNLRQKKDAQVIVVCAKIEEEMAELEDDEKAMFLEELGIEESGLDQLIKASYSFTWTCYILHSRCTRSTCMDIP